MGGFLEMLGIDARTESYFDARTKCLNVGKSSDSAVVDFPLVKSK